ncbi:MAG: hypothetical protein OEL84_08265, partial [Nitrosopumilus sp.]|nr:hypothetical protein [Nitrosopumilus sp.]
MNNEIGRKITSLTLMTIMLAGGMTFAAPSMMPAAFAANANLFVSAENSQFDNYMSGPQVIEVVVIDSDINDTDQAKGEPDVTVNGKILRMVQGVDGNWYGYFADRNMAVIADATSTTLKTGLDFGTFCTSGASIAGLPAGSFTDTVGVAVPDSTEGDEGAVVIATAAGGPLVIPGITACTGAPFALDAGNVVREAKRASTIPGGGAIGQIGLGANTDLPFIQLYPLNPTGNVIIQYNKGGGVQTTTLTFDTVDQFAAAGLDKAKYTRGAQVHATITDLWLNIDPTDEDSWTFETVGDISTNYQVFDENGSVAGGLGVGNAASNTDANLLTGQLVNLMCEDNCRLLLNPDVQGKGFVATLQDNDDSVLSGDSTFGTFVAGTPAGIAPNGVPADDPTRVVGVGSVFTLSTDATKGAVPITFTEQGPNSGVFGSYDESDTSNIRITSTAARGTSASIEYNEDSVSILVGLSFGSIDIKPLDDEWNSGEEIPVELFDGDANRNSRADEDLDLNDPAVKLIPALKTGTPATLFPASELSVATPGFASGSLSVKEVQKFSDRAILVSTAPGPLTTTGAPTDMLALTFGTMEDFFEAAPVNDGDFEGFALFNYDVRSLANSGNLGVSTVDITFPGGSSLLAQPLQGTAIIDDTTQDATSVFGAIAPSTPLTVTFTLNGVGAGETIPVGTELPIVADIFGFGFLNDGLEDNERIANQLIRLELEETGDNTGIFAGSLEYTMINQLNILDPDTYSDLDTISDEATFIVIEDLDDEESPRVNYLDLGADGVSTQVADQEEAPSHSGIVSFDLDTYKTADTVNITLEDLDLNVDSDLIDIYTTVSGSAITALNDVVGSDAHPFELSDGDRLGRVLDITFDDQLWTDRGNACSTLLGGDKGLASTGFTLIETERDSGVFMGSFQIPDTWCREGATSPESATGLDIEVNYVDFRDASGEVIEVGDSAGIRATTGSVSLDRTVYPVPFGVPSNFGVLTGVTSPDNRSIFPIHATGINTDLTASGSFLANGDLTVHIRVNDPDFDISASGEDEIAQNRSDIPVGPVEVSIIRGSETVILGHAGGSSVIDGKIFVGDEIPVNQAFSGDGVIALGELSDITDDGAMGFMTGDTITIAQTGAAGASALFTEVAGDGIFDLTGDTIMITNSDTGFAGAETVTISQPGATSASIAFVDGNGDGNVEAGELALGPSGSGFITGPVTITGVTSLAVATGAFTDAVFTNGIIDDGELSALVGGSGYTDGTVTLTGAMGGTATATFTDELTVVDPNFIKDFGPIDEIAPDAGIFELDLKIKYTDGPSDSQCPTTVDFDAGKTGTQVETDRFSTASPSGENYCILQGDILQVEYTDPTDASGDINTVTDSATFDLRNGVLQSDKSVYIIGSDMILTLIEPDLDLDNDQAETWDLDLIEWDSDAATVTMGDADGEGGAFDPEPLNFRETGDSTGIFQIIIEIPEVLAGDRLERGEEIILEYTDWGPSGSDFVGDEDEDINLTLFTSNFGATVELDQKVYTWTDKVYITIVAPDHNFDSDLVDEIGNTDLDPIKVSTRGSDIDNYKLVETGTDTGIFTGEVILTGFTHDADGDSTTGTGGNDVISRSA